MSEINLTTEEIVRVFSIALHYAKILQTNLTSGVIKTDKLCKDMALVQIAQDVELLKDLTEKHGLGWYSEGHN